MTSVLEVLYRYWTALRAEVLWLALALALFGLAWGSLRRPLQLRRARHLVIAVVITAGLAWSLHLGWIADDAFISFRYARNWVDGMGLVFNAGERVEGYTNFLWIVVLSPFQAMGLSLPPISVALTLVCFALTLASTARFSAHLQQQLPGRAGAGFNLPIAAGLLALNYTFASFGTSGLETMFATLLLLLSIERAEAGAALASGALAIGATLTHPDHAIFYACLGAVFVYERRFRSLLLFGLPFALVYVPYFAWRWSYYGDFFPNTYYVKNGGLFYFSQGLRYLALSGMSSGLWAALPLTVYAVWRLRHLRIARFAAVAVPVFLFYVAKVGGDFMLGRLICPLLPVVYILAELGIRSLIPSEARASRSRAAAGLAAFCTAAVPVRFIKPNEIYAHVADERTFYPIGSYLPFSLDSSYRHVAESFNRRFEKLSRKPALAMFSVGIVGYETGLRLVDNAGLNHRGVAHWRNRHRGRPGHEKIISPGLLVQSPADLSDVPVYPQPYEALGSVLVDGVRFHTVKYESRLFSELAATGVAPPPLPQYIRDYVPAASPTRLECDLWHMRQIHFRHEVASDLAPELLRKVAESRPEWANHAAFLLGTSPEAASWRRVDRIHFDELHADAQLSGHAFAHNPMARESVGQPPMAGTRGRFINTFQDADGDLATGEFMSQQFRITGDLITLHVGGGYFPEHAYVELLVGGERRFHATGCNSGILGVRLWRTRELRGQLAVLHIVDRRRSHFGHIVVDELAQWKNPEHREGDAGSAAVASQPGPERAAP